jgi:hypothetical protein
VQVWIARAIVERHDGWEETCRAKPGHHQNTRKSTPRPVVDKLAPPSTSQRRPFTGFDIERATYSRLKPDLLVSAEGKYVVIVGDELIGPLESHEAAERAGYKRFGLGHLYVKQLSAEEPVLEVSRSFYK